MNDPALKVWILLQMDGEVICAHCTCIAGLSETCSHVGAVCFFILSITESSEHVTLRLMFGLAITSNNFRSPLPSCCVSGMCPNSRKIL